MLLFSACTPSGSEHVDTAITVSPASTPDFATSSTEAPLEAPSDLIVLPTDASIAEALGFDLRVVARATDEARFGRVATCMRLDGWEFDRSMLPSTEPLDDPGLTPSSYAGHAQAAIKQITAIESAPPDGSTVPGPTMPVGESPAASEAMSSSLATCWEAAVTAIDYPLEALDRWLATEMVDLNASVGADPRVLAARDTEYRCMAEAGFPYDPEFSNSVFMESKDIFDAYRDGLIDADEAIALLEPIAEREHLVAEAHVPCILARLEVERTVRAETEEVWLKDHGDRLILAISELVDLDPIADILEELVDSE